MFSSSKCNQFSIIQSARDNLGNGKPQLTPLQGGEEGKNLARGLASLPCPLEVDGHLAGFAFPYWAKLGAVE